MPALSIILPVLDEAATVAATLSGLQAWRGRGHELIVVDGGSADSTAALAAPLCDALVLAPRGRASQMNAGAERARGDVLLFLHADTHLPDDAPAVLLAALKSGARVWGRHDVRIVGRSRWLPVVAALMNRRSRWSGIATGDQAIFVTRAAFAQIGGFPDQPIMEDIAASRALLRLSRPICLNGPAVTSGRRWDRHGALRTILLMWRLRAAYYFGADPRKLAIRYGYAPRES